MGVCGVVWSGVGGSMWSGVEWCGGVRACIVGLEWELWNCGSGVYCIVASFKQCQGASS